MGRTYQILLPLLGLFLVRVDLTDLYPLSLIVKVVKIYDGDTVLVKHGSYQMKIRLSKIDAPESRQPFLTQAGDAGLYSKNCLKSLLNKKSTLAQLEKQDMYGRILGDVDGVSFKLIKNGCATLYPYANFRSVREKMKFLVALKIAKTSRRGLWRYGGIKQPKIWRKFNKPFGHPGYHQSNGLQKFYPPGRKHGKKED